MDLAHYWFQAGKGATGYGIGNSLRFRGAQALSRAGSGLITQHSYTFSFWIKGVELGGASGMLYSRGASTTTEYFYFKWQDSPWWYHYTGQDAEAAKVNGVLRDPSAWYHVVLTRPAGQGGSIYINGVDRSSKTATGNMDPFAYDMFIGAISTAGVSGFDGYLAEVHGIHGEALAPTEFGEFNDDGVWVPKKVSGLTYGTNGFYLDFSDASNIGADRSGNGNNFTATGFELTDTTSTNYDWVADSPTQNYATLNPLKKTSSAATEDANLLADLGAPGGSSNGCEQPANFAVSSGKWYWEINPGSQYSAPGIILTSKILSTASFSGGYHYYGNDGQFYTDTTPTASGDTFGSGDIIGVALNLDADEITFYKNGVSQGAQTIVPGEYNPDFASALAGTNTANFGQRPFRYDPPAGFEPLQSQELPAVDITKPSDHFEVITDTGANILTAAQAKFPNGLWWIKDRANANQHQLVDSIRGNNQALFCPASQAETAYTNPSGNSVAWCWSAPTVWNTPAGTNGATITAGGRVNTDAGFSIVTYTGNGTNGATVAHGLNQAPEMIFVRRSNSGVGNINCQVYHSHLNDGANPEQYAAFLNLNNAAGAFSQFWNNTAPTDLVFTLGNQQEVNGLGGDVVAYCWHSVPGYSAFGSYTGNNNTDGSFIYTGFKPAFVLIKKTTSTSQNQDWIILDSARNSSNPVDLSLFPNQNYSENTGFNFVDFLSNGLKFRNTYGNTNWTDNYIYAAFAEHPFGGSNVSPTTAR
jgi:hypothetical protein